MEPSPPTLPLPGGFGHFPFFFFSLSHGLPRAAPLEPSGLGRFGAPSRGMSERAAHEESRRCESASWTRVVPGGRGREKRGGGGFPAKFVAAARPRSSSSNLFFQAACLLPRGDRWARHLGEVAFVLHKSVAKKFPLSLFLPFLLSRSSLVQYGIDSQLGCFNFYSLQLCTKHTMQEETPTP